MITLENKTLTFKGVEPPKGRFIVQIATVFILKWSRPILVNFVSMLIKEAAKNEKIESFIESVLVEIDPDSNGQIDK